MTMTKLALKAIAVVAILAPCIVTIASAYWQSNVVVFDGHVSVSSGPPTHLQCKLTLRVVNVDKHDVLNLRELPSPNSPVRLGIPPNARGLIDLGERNGAWRRVQFGGSGWVNGTYVADDAVLCLPNVNQPAAKSRPPQDASNAIQPAT
jgi:hypothetical protein